MPGKLTEFWAYVATDYDGNEGFLTALHVDKGYVEPLIATDQERLESQMGEAQKWARQNNQPVRLLRFALCEEVAVIEPPGNRN